MIKISEIIKTVDLEVLRVVYGNELIDLIDNLAKLKSLELDPKYYNEVFVLFGTEIDVEFYFNQENGKYYINAKLIESEE